MRARLRALLPRLRPLAPLVALLLGVAVAWWLGRGARPASLPCPAWLARVLGAPEDAQIRLLRPRAPLLLPLALAPYLAWVARRSLLDAARLQIAGQAALRLLVLAALGLAVAEPQIEAPLRGKTVVAVVDLSDSMDDTQVAAARRWWEELADAVATESRSGVDPEDRTRLRLVTYGAQATAHPPQAGEGAAWTRPAGEAALASDHAGALRLSRALIDPDTAGRVLLVTDGRGSLAEREDLARTLADLSSEQVPVTVRAPPPAVREDVLVRAVHAPLEPHLGETFHLAVDLWASRPGPARLRVDKDGAPNPLTPHLDLELRGGPQQVLVPVRVTRPGPVTFTARLDPASLDPARNRTPLNDAASTASLVRGRPRVLHVGSDPSSALPRALRADHLDVEDVRPSQMPTTLEALRAYDLVILSDVSSGSIGAARQRLLETYVEELGGGLVMVGGEHAYGPGGWAGTPVERLLPVRFEGERERQQPTLALMLVIDKSGSMSSEDKLDLVKEAARATARALDPSDEIGVIAFDSQPQVLVRLQPAANRIRIVSNIRRLTAGGGTHALPALREAYLQLAGSDALVKHVILLSDGESPEKGIAALLADMRDADITVSTVGVGAGAGKDLLARIARWGRGRFYYSQDATDVPRIFSRETTEVTRNAIQERAFYPRVARRAQVLRGIDFTSAPGLRGLVPVAPKPLAEVLLRTQDGAPLLVRGRRGLGRTVAFASDAKPRWAARWLSWPGFPKLWSQIARDTMRRGATSMGGATVKVTQAGPGRFRVAVDVEGPEGFPNDLVGEAELLGGSDEAGAAPGGADSPGDAATLRVPLELSAPGRYEADLPHDPGTFLVRARLRDPSVTPPRPAAEAVGRVTIPYPPELAPTEAGTLDLAASSADGATEGPVAALVTEPTRIEGRTRARPLWPFVLSALLLPLLLLDLLTRRLVLPRAADRAARRA